MGLFTEPVDCIATENAFPVGSHIRQLEKASGRAIKCNLGEPGFPVPEFITDEVNRKFERSNSHSRDPQRLLSPRTTVATSFCPTRGIPATPERVVMFPGAKPRVGVCQQTYCEPGDEVIYPSLGSPINKSFVRYLDATPIPMHLAEQKGFSSPGADRARPVSPRTKQVWSCSPSNPTDGVASLAQCPRLRAVVQLSLHSIIDLRHRGAP